MRKVMQSERKMSTIRLNCKKEKKFCNRKYAMKNYLVNYAASSVAVFLLFFMLNYAKSAKLNNELDNNSFNYNKNNNNINNNNNNHNNVIENNYNNNNNNNNNNNDNYLLIKNLNEKNDLVENLEIPADFSEISKGKLESNRDKIIEQINQQNERLSNVDVDGKSNKTKSIDSHETKSAEQDNKLIDKKIIKSTASSELKNNGQQVVQQQQQQQQQQLSDYKLQENQKQPTTPQNNQHNHHRKEKPRQKQQRQYHHHHHKHHHHHHHNHNHGNGNNSVSGDVSRKPILKSSLQHFHHSKFTIEELLNTKFEHKTSNDIDMDPCKAEGFMGDIALTDAEYGEPIVAISSTNVDEMEMMADAPATLKTTLAMQKTDDSQGSSAAASAENKQKFNATFQQELEILKQEVYHEGLQVEEEGMTDIIRRKTKLPGLQSSVNSHEYSNNNNNNPVLSANEPVKPTSFSVWNESDKNYKNEVISSRQYRSEDSHSQSHHHLQQETDEHSYYDANKLPKNEDAAASVLDDYSFHQRKSQGGSQVFRMPTIRLSNVPEITNKNNNEKKSFIERNGNEDKDSIEEANANGGEHKEGAKPLIGLASRHEDERKIQSNTKDIIDDTGKNFVSERKVIILPTSPPIQRSTLPNVYSNAGGNGMKLDGIDFMHSSGVVRQRHRRRHKNRRSSSSHAEYKAKVQRLKEELDRPVRIKIVDDWNSKRHNKFNATTNATKSNDYRLSQDFSEKAFDTRITQSQENSRLKAHEQQKRRNRMTRAVTAKKERIWDYGVIPYEIDGNFSGLHKALFKQAMRHWENFTCIKFVERDPEIHPNYIVFTVRSCGCCSFVGKRGNGPQAISIGRNCDKFGIVVHELGHVVGFWHEHTRPDREKHVVIELNNIMKGQDYNFNKLSPEEVDSLGMAYDYDSIMHYARNTFSKGTYLDTILPIEVKGKKRPEIGQRLRLSSGDIAQANLLYRCSQCGRTFQENTGVFASPSYYTAGALTNETESCEWRITATHGERVVLRLENLNIMQSENCETDYLEIRDGYYFKSPLIGRFCGKANNEVLTTQTSRMLLSYVNKHRSDGYRGFKAEFDVICGGELTIDDADGRLESPNYPLEYLANKECIWKITVPKGYQVALKFQSFEVENHDSCVYDFVEVRDGPTQDSPLIGVFCGYKPPPNMKSSGDSMFVKFVSDTSVQKAGFSAIFMKEVDECETQNHGCEHDCINTLGGYECSCHIGYELHSDKKHCETACGGVIEYPNGTITSPSFPETYPVLKDCIWEIIAPPKHKISLNFSHFDLEGTTHQQSDCGYDYVTIYSKLSENRLKRIGIYCGSAIPPTATSEGNALRIEFHSDKSIQKTGFAAVFFTDIDECSVNNGGCQHECHNTIGSYMCSCHNGYSLHENGHDCKEGECKSEILAPFGTIYSPNFPDPYPPNADCVWHFQTTPGHRIKLIFNEFTVESHQECAYDNVAIYDGDSESSSILGRFCGDKIPYPISSSTNQLYMVFKTDKNKQMNGFAAIHSTSCGGYLRVTSQIQQFYSHARFGNHNYNENMDCEWTLQAPPNSHVQLTFLTFDLESSENCTYDYVQVFSGMEDTSGTLYGQFCGLSLPEEIISATDSLLVRLKTDSSIIMKGFSASYVAVDYYENSDEGSNSYSVEMATPFPGSLHNIFKEDDATQETEDYGDISDNQLSIHSPYQMRNRYYSRF